MNEKIIIDRMDAEEFYRMLIEEADVVHRSKTVHSYAEERIIRSIADDFRELCGGKAATDDWEV